MRELHLEPGRHQVNFGDDQFSSGVYSLRLTQSGSTKLARAVVVR